MLFSDEKLFDIDGIHSSQNYRICVEADIKGGIRQIRKFPQKIMVWLGACSKGLSPLVVFENRTVAHNRYINEVLPVALKYGNSIFGNDWTFQQEGVKPHFHEKTQAWCANNFPSFIQGNHWPPNSPAQTDKIGKKRVYTHYFSVIFRLKTLGKTLKAHILTHTSALFFFSKWKKNR